MFALIVGLSEVMAWAADGQEVFVEVPCVAEIGVLAAGFMSLHLSKVPTPICDGSGREGDGTFGHARFTQRFAGVIPNTCSTPHVCKGACTATLQGTEIPAIVIQPAVDLSPIGCHWDGTAIKVTTCPMASHSSTPRRPSPGQLLIITAQALAK
jgi:hypothetical protein